ncbi:MAG: nicotinamide riboside transporter PnuC [Prevotella sp.]|nr:nicotinamide riboside transporter PnuC [Prevotella sp.]
MDIAGAVLGLLYLFFEFRRSAWMWVTGLVMPAVYMVVLFQKGIYADCGMEAYYFLAGIYGLCYWIKGGTKKEKRVEISRVPEKLIVVLSVIAAVLWGCLWLFLAYCTDSTVPCIDAFTTALSVVALWLLSRKYIEQWWLWFVVDLVSTGLYVYKGLYGRALLYAIYTVAAVYGYRFWKKRMESLSAV